MCHPSPVARGEHDLACLQFIFLCAFHLQQVAIAHRVGHAHPLRAKAHTMSAPEQLGAHRLKGGIAAHDSHRMLVLICITCSTAESSGKNSRRWHATVSSAWS